MTGNWRIIRDDVLDVLTNPDDHELGIFDGSLSDPPYGLKFMGKRWDHGVPSADVYRALGERLRPGALVLAFGGTRTYHRLACNIEDAGLEKRDEISVDGYGVYIDHDTPRGPIRWYYGSGWPKPANVAKYLDGKAGIDTKADDWIPTTKEAQRFEGYHANLAPAWEPVIVARKPLDRTLANNALEHGLAGFNVDGCRVEASGRPARAVVGNNRDHNNHASGPKASQLATGTTDLGRWPANVILTCDEAICGPGDPREIEHQPGCHVFELDRQSGTRRTGPAKYALSGVGTSTAHCETNATGKKARGATSGHDDEGGASRFFYTAKVSKTERGVSAHPCMKPIALTTYLARLILPPPRADGQPRRILVPFSGSGSEMWGCLAAGWDEVIGIEQDESCDNPGKRPDYWADVAEHRIREWLGTLRAEDIKPDIAPGPVQLGLL